MSFRLPASSIGICVAACAALLSGCAGTPPAPTITHKMVVNERVSQPDTVTVRIENDPGVEVLPSTKERVTEKIQAKIDQRKLTNPASQDPRTLEVLVHVTRYEKGNAFARAMMAGFGQIHIDGTITLYRMPDHVVVEEFALAKTFAWGGVYGAATTIETIEDTFADGIAQTVTGQQPPETQAHDQSKPAAAAPKAH
jgi:hypothetical protein